MKQSTFKAKLSQYYDVDPFIDKTIEQLTCGAILDDDFDKFMNKLGVDEKDRTDMMFDIIANEEDARKEGREPARKVYYYTEYEEPEPGKVPAEYKNQNIIREVWLDYTEEDYQFLVQYREDLLAVFHVTTPDEYEAQQRITQRFGENADLITAECLTIMHSLTKADCKEYLDRTRNFIKSSDFTEDLERVLIKVTTKDFVGNTLTTGFLGRFVDSFIHATQEARRKEYKELYGNNPKEFVSFVFQDTERLRKEAELIIAQWYDVPAVSQDRHKEVFLRHNKLAQSKETNALQALNLARDFKEVLQTSTRSGGIQASTLFENNGVEIESAKVEDVSLSTSSRQLLQYFQSKATEQITHKIADLNRLDKQRAVTVTLDEIAQLFFESTTPNAKKEARKLLNTFYEETRDLKITLKIWKKEKGKTSAKVAHVNIFDADLQEVDLEEKNATARPEDVDEGVQITLYNTGTLLNYNPKRKKGNKSVVKNERLTMVYSMTFAKHLAQSPVLKHNEKVYRLDRRRNRPAVAIANTLEVHAHRNRDKSNAGIISIGNVLKDCYELPTYEEVRKGNRNYTKRIKKPFIDNVQALKDGDILQEYHYCTPKGARISKEKLQGLDYDDFIACTLHFTLSPIEDEIPLLPEE